MISYLCALRHTVCHYAVHCQDNKPRAADLSTVDSLSGADIPHTVFDAHISALEAGIGAFPRRLMVPDGYYVAAVNLLKDSSEFYDD